MKKWIALVFSFLFLSLPLTALAASPWMDYDYSRFNNQTFLYDNSDSISSGVFEEYSHVLADMQQRFGVTYVFVIVNDYDGPARELADYIWEHGGFDTDYISLVVSLASRDFAVDTYGKGIDIMSDLYVSGMLDVVGASLSAGDFDQAVRDFADLAAKMTEGYLNNSFSVTASDGTVIFRTQNAANEAQQVRLVLPQAIFLIICIALLGGLLTALIGSSIVIRKHRPVKSAAQANSVVPVSDMKMAVQDDVFLRTFTTKTRIQTDSGSGGSTRGSTSIGSSGRSRGGGSRGF
jgi:uncharacterized protein